MGERGRGVCVLRISIVDSYCLFSDVLGVVFTGDELN